MFNPISTYRLQFHKDFNFEDFEAVIPYLKALGAGTVYASPVFRSVPGSNHGYDGTDPLRINPEIGTLEQLIALSRALKDSGIGWIQDIVPNHMAFHPENPWLTDVLEKGRDSAYYLFFDIIPDHPDTDGKLIVPFLGDSPDQVIERGELKVGCRGRLVLQYFDQSFPLNRRSYARILRLGPEPADQAVRDLRSELDRLHQVEDPEIYSREWNEFLLRLQALMKDPGSARFMESCLDQVNSRPDLLKELAGDQEYELCRWSDTDRRISYRRFFTVNSLICLNMQDPRVFAHYHRLIGELAGTGIFNGLRVDHVDGLSDPSGYLGQLRELAGEDAYLTVEKILEPGEKLPSGWPVEGSTGYDFLGMVNNLLTRKESEPAFTAYYRLLTGQQTPIAGQIAEKKRKILYEHMAGELENLVRMFPRNPGSGLERSDLRDAIGAFLVACPVYRYYGNRIPLEPAERAGIQAILDGMRASAAVPAHATGALGDVLLYDGRDRDYARQVLRFYQRLMQFTGPLMAKGVEDTLMYTFNRFIGHNEVGDSPETFGIGIEEFHRLMQERQAESPMSMNATSTHDTKRGEDVRARLNVLTDLAGEWLQLVEIWRDMNADLKLEGAPDDNDEYFIYQTLIGAYPMPGEDASGFPERMREYLVKALREGKVRSGWTRPDESYEKAVCDFAEALLDPGKPFWSGFSTFQRKVAGFGIVNSLVQLILKFTCPGIPDVYQGTEHWDLSFVDPDNRRPVDFAARGCSLQDLQSADPAGLWEHRYDGRIKVWLTALLFRLRRMNNRLFTDGAYIPLTAEGKYKDHICSFARRYRDEWLVVVVPLHPALMAEDPGQVPDWEDTRIVLPAGSPRQWRDELTGRAGIRQVNLQDLLQTLPALILRPEKNRSRGAGILLSLTSLPSDFGIGDMGPEAYAFADFLARSRQKYWQLLPLNPTDASQMHSPYSSVSAMAGNTLLVSPERLTVLGLLTAEDCRAFRQESSGTVDFERAGRIREELFLRAWNTFQSGGFTRLTRAFRKFVDAEQDWLDDYALFTALNEKLGSPWYEWPREFRMRDRQALETFAAAHREELERIRFLQFIFQLQWSELKKYCNQNGIDLLGDLPFYVSCHSSDVWANKELFHLDAEGRMAGIAGVPPDYFNAEGQLWGMPVFRWDVLRRQGYAWWIRRLARNLDLYDLVRLDHFRAFSAYWEVAPDSGTAREGSWKPGPGADFFRAVRAALGGLPFLAEDLGDIDEPVYRLRDEFSLPGMKVLQFAFGGDLPESLNAPHNYGTNFFVYTGTHDNNTSKGWFSTEADEDTIRSLERYTGIRPTGLNVHRILARTAYASVAGTVILPMQDLLGLDGTARMNTPAAISGNWFWRLKKGQAGPREEEELRTLVTTFNR